MKKAAVFGIFAFLLAVSFASAAMIKPADSDEDFCLRVSTDKIAKPHPLQKSSAKTARPQRSARDGPLLTPETCLETA